MFPAMMSSKVAAVLATVLLGASLVPRAGGAGADNKLVIGMELSYPPFEMTDENNKPSGIGVELGQALAAYLHREADIQNTEFTGLIPALKTGKIDLVISSMTATDERRKSIDFSEPYMNTGICLLVGANSDIHSIADVDKPGRKVAVKSGTTGFVYAKAHFTQAQVVPLNKRPASSKWSREKPTPSSTTRCRFFRSTSAIRRPPVPSWNLSRGKAGPSAFAKATTNSANR